MSRRNPRRARQNRGSERQFQPQREGCIWVARGWPTIPSEYGGREQVEQSLHEHGWAPTWKAAEAAGRQAARKHFPTLHFVWSLMGVTPTERKLGIIELSGHSATSKSRVRDFNVYAEALAPRFKEYMAYLYGDEGRLPTFYELVQGSYHPPELRLLTAAEKQHYADTVLHPVDAQFPRSKRPARSWFNDLATVQVKLIPGVTEDQYKNRPA